MRVRRGLFRLWCAVSALWIAFVTLYIVVLVYEKGNRLPEDFYEDNICGLTRRLDGQGKYEVCVQEKKAEFILRTGWKPSYDILMPFLVIGVLGILPSVILGGLMYLVLWVVRGFTEKDGLVPSDHISQEGGKGPWGSW